MNYKIFTSDFLVNYFKKKKWLYIDSVSFDETEWDEINREAIAKALDDVFDLRLDVEILDKLPTDPAELDPCQYDFLIQTAIRYYESLVD